MTVLGVITPRVVVILKRVTTVVIIFSAVALIAAYGFLWVMVTFYTLAVSVRITLEEI
jgi:hypothetical protein